MGHRAKPDDDTGGCSSPWRDSFPCPDARASCRPKASGLRIPYRETPKFKFDMILFAKLVRFNWFWHAQTDEVPVADNFFRIAWDW